MERDFRPDVQGLRAIAVSLVVIYHLFPGTVTGGYVGVDVFFVISGFLITGHLARTLEHTGRVSLVDFYGRRARRLMPAAVLVLTVTWLASLAVMARTQLPDTARQIRASALYFENWVLAHDSVTYLKSENAPTPVQHFWSLSVEEQFYLFWPLLFLAAAAVGLWAHRHRRTELPSRTVVLVLAVAALVASLWYSATETVTDPSAAYFVTPTRIWELALGGVLALLPLAATRWLARIGPLAWVGLVMIAASALLLDESTAFPGVVAGVPVLGAALVLASGSASARGGPARLTSARPMVFVGDISYSLYLWHWPMIVLWKQASGGDIGVLDGPALAAGAVLLSWLTKRYVEDSFRLAPMFRRHAWRSIATVVLVIVPVGLTSGWLMTQPATTAPTRLDAQHPGAAVLAGDATAARDVAPVPDLTKASKDWGGYGKGPHGCQTNQDDAPESLCYFGATTGYTKTIALVGDSAAGTWFDDLNAMAKRKNWRLVTDLHGICPWTATVGRRPYTDDEPYTGCYEWGKNVVTTMLTRIKPDLIVTTSRPAVGTVDHPKAGPQAWAQIGAGMVTYWDRMLDAGIEVVAIRETPEMGLDVPDCLSRPGAKREDCSVSTKKAVRDKTPTVVATKLADGRVPLIDLNRFICRPDVCEPVVGNVVVYIDEHHITTTYTQTVAPYLEKRLLKMPSLRR